MGNVGASNCRIFCTLTWKVQLEKTGRVSIVSRVNGLSSKPETVRRKPQTCTIRPLLPHAEPLTITVSSSHLLHLSRLLHGRRGGPIYRSDASHWSSQVNVFLSPSTNNSIPLVQSLTVVRIRLWEMVRPKESYSTSQVTLVSLGEQNKCHWKETNRERITSVQNEWLLCFGGCECDYFVLPRQLESGFHWWRKGGSGIGEVEKGERRHEERRRGGGKVEREMGEEEGEREEKKWVRKRKRKRRMVRKRKKEEGGREWRKGYIKRKEGERARS